MTECRYLLRFDDICPTMNWKVWDAIERILIAHDVRPILAVVPENLDPKLMVDAPHPDFWNKVRGWQNKGYAIALHGYQHAYVNENPGIMKLTRHSEFAGLPYGEQERKLKNATAIFAKHGIRADAWVAPSHSFDTTTIRALAELGVTVISDGLWPWPHLAEDKMLWVPQQLWKFRPKTAGVWTVCFHHNSWSENKVEMFKRDLERYASRMTDLASVTHAFASRSLTLTDRGSALGNFLWDQRIRPFIAKWWWRWRPRPTF